MGRVFTILLVDDNEVSRLTWSRFLERNGYLAVAVKLTASGIPYLVMELLHGHSLHQELKRKGRLPALGL